MLEFFTASKLKTQVCWVELCDEWAAYVRHWDPISCLYNHHESLGHRWCCIMHVDTLTYSMRDCYPQMVLDSHEDMYVHGSQNGLCLPNTIN